MTTKKSNIAIPERFCIAPFYPKNATIPENLLSEKFDQTVSYYFLPDITFYYGKTTGLVEPPWHNPEKIRNIIMTSWKQTGIPRLKDCFNQRDRVSAKPLMLKYLSFYIQLMHWIQGQPVHDIRNVPTDLSQREFSPMNITDRLSFILTSPDHHHSFTTLIQIFEETNKKWAIYLKQKKNRG
ncbi:YpoC family protein [Evansella tamaricis]|uniref:YpoC-like domain-containing protein n=1 Tax=Evansella tamaricis TaxID=2069301 RepID=A0ABS6JLS9_9BACI|nr:hypothetical protein [Evansella tamaricis]MBU9714636.1 hypothetical protein [Evansella tamaricis]